MRAGTLSPGDALPSIRALSASLLVSAITVRKAYDELEASGVIARERGRGTFVRATDAASNVAKQHAEHALVSAVSAALRAGLDRAAVETLVQQELAACEEG